MTIIFLSNTKLNNLIEKTRSSFFYYKVIIKKTQIFNFFLKLFWPDELVRNRVDLMLGPKFSLTFLIKKLIDPNRK